MNSDYSNSTIMTISSPIMVYKTGFRRGYFMHNKPLIYGHFQNNLKASFLRSF